MGISTTEFENQIKSAQSMDELREIIKQLPKISFTVRISELCEKYNTNFSKVQIESGISRSLFYAITNGTRTPQKNQIIKIGLAMKLTLEEVNELLKLAQHKELYAKNKDDAVIIFGIKRGLRVEKIQALLIDNGSKLQLLDE